MDQYRAWRNRREFKKNIGVISRSIAARIGGRQTKEKWEEQFSWYEGTIKRHYTREKNTMDTLKLIRDINPDTSMAIWNFLRLSNQGHELDCLNLDGSEDEEGRKLLNELAARVGSLYGDGGGKDQLVNVLLLTAFTQGAVALEVELTEGLDDVVDYHAIDPSTLDFRRNKDTGDIELVQRQKDGKYIVLNRDQTFYYPIDPDIGDPYGRSPILPVLQIVFFQVEVLRDLKAVAHNQGHARFDISVVEEAIMKNIPKPIQNKGQQAVMEFVENYISEIKKAFDELKPDDNFFHTDSVKVDMAGGTTGKSMDVTKIINVINQQVVTALKQLPILLGRNEGTTETHGTIQWQIYVSGIKSIQRSVKRILERADNVALQVWGRQSKAKLSFNTVRDVDRRAEAEAEAVETRTKIMQVNQGWIDNDEAANEIVGHNAVNEPIQINSSSFGMMRNSRNTRTAKAKTIRANRNDEPEEDEVISKVDMPWAGPVARVTTEFAQFTEEAFTEQKSLYTQRIKDSSSIPTRALISAKRNDDEEIPEPSQEFSNWVKDNILVDSLRWKRYFENRSLERLAEAASIAGEYAIEALGMDVEVEFDVRNPHMMQQLAERAGTYSQIQDTTDEAVIWELWEGAWEGESIGQMVKRIENMPYLNTERAYVIARTEVLTAARAGNQEGWRQSGVVLGKRWNTSIDGRERPTHADINGKVVRLDEPYVLSDGDRLMYPGDSSLGAKLSNIIQCRCAEEPIVDEEDFN